MQIQGSMDFRIPDMLGPDSVANQNGFRIYDRAWRPKTHFFVYGLRHNPFNRVWVVNGDTFETGLENIALPPQDHERITKCLVNAFFQNAFLGQAAYGGYMEGTTFPESLAPYHIHTQYSTLSRFVLDNFGDSDEQVPLPLGPLDKTRNRQQQSVTANGSGLIRWDIVEHTNIARSPHNTKGLQLSWGSPDVVYQSNTGGSSQSVTGVVAFRVAQFYPDAALNPDATPLDLFVALSDGSNEATVRLGAVAQVPFPDRSGICPMRTVRLPLDAFVAANPALDVTQIQSVALRLIGRDTGNILADDFELGN